MAETTPSRTISLISILFLLLTTAPEPTRSLPFSFAQYRTVVSLSHSLMTRVANLRASRGDVSGSRRAHLIAEKLESGLSLGFFGLTWSLGWDYLKNYAWRDLNYAEMYGVVSDVNELLKSVGELTRANSDAERATWAGRNYQNVLGVSTSLFKKLLKVFAKSGTLREAVKVAEREVVQGGLLKDCLELGSNDLKGLLQILKDLASSVQFQKYFSRIARVHSYMESAKQRIRAAAACQKEEKRAKGELASSSVPKTITKGALKRRTDGKDRRPLKKVAVTPRNEPPEKSTPALGNGAGKGVMTSSGPVLEGPHCLLTHKDYAVEEIETLIKSTDIDPCALLGTEELGASALFDLARALVRVKTIQDWCVAKEGVVTRVSKHNANMLNQQAQYKEAIRLLNVELKETKQKLEEAGRQKEKLEQELTTLREQVETAGVDTVQKFKALDSFIDSCGGYYDTGFDDCLKQVASTFPELDLSRITLDDALPMTPANDVVVVKGDGSENAPPHDDNGVVLAQPAANPPVTTFNPFVEVLDVEVPLVQISKKTSSDALFAQP